MLPPLIKGDRGLPWRDLVAICRNLTMQLCSISLSYKVSRPGLGQGGDFVRLMWKDICLFYKVPMNEL
jgi:hypothetical protein